MAKDSMKEGKTKLWHDPTHSARSNGLTRRVTEMADFKMLSSAQRFQLAFCQFACSFYLHSKRQRYKKFLELD